jgi:hypothetical protein
MSYETSKVDWDASGNPGPGDFNRIEKNIAWLKGQRNIKIPTNGSSFTIELPEGLESVTVTVMVWAYVSFSTSSSSGYGYVSIKIGSSESNKIAASLDEYSGAKIRSWLAVTATVTNDFTVEFYTHAPGGISVTISEICPIAQIYYH